VKEEKCVAVKKAKQPTQWWPPSGDLLLAARDISLFAVGFAGIINELFLSGTKDGQTMLFCAGLCGLPFILNLSGEGK